MKNLKAGFVAAVLIALAVLFYLQHQVQEKLHAENVALAQLLAQMQTDNEILSNRLASAGDANSLSDKEHNELLKLRGEVGTLKNQLATATKIQAQAAVHVDPANQPADLLEQQKRMTGAKAGDAHIYLHHLWNMPKVTMASFLQIGTKLEINITMCRV